MNFIDIILDTIHDTWAMLPLLYVTYCVLEVFERKNTQDDKLFFGLQRLGPILGALVGLIPQCGFSILAAMLFVQNNITLGTLVSVMIATSDEAIPILISNPKMYSSLLGILGLKLIIAIVVGLFTDHVLFRNQKSSVSKIWKKRIMMRMNTRKKKALVQAVHVAILSIHYGSVPC